MKSKIDVADEDENFEKMGLNISGCSKIRTVRGNLTCGQALLCAHVWYGTVLVNGCNETKRQNIVDVLNRSSERLFNEEEFLTKYGHDMASMFVVYCRFMRNTKCSDKDFVPTVTQNGLCFTFNSGHNDTVLYSLFEGPDLGLNIILNVQTNESTLSEFSNGLKVIVHDQKTFVNRHNGFNILPGTHASVAVKLRKHIRLPAPFRTNCQQTKLPGIGSYTKDGCLYQCIVNTTITQCGCRRLGLPEPKEAPLCSMQDSSCVFNSRKQLNITECPCNSACSELEYEAAVSYSKFPDNSIVQILHKFFGKTETSSYMRENYVFLQVGFKHLAYENREDVPSYGTESLFVRALYCYVCSSDESFEECTKTQKKQECPGGNYRCFYQHIDYSDSQGKRVKTYTKGCTLPSECSKDTRPICQEREKEYDSVTCEITCCSGGICNETSGSMAVISSVLLVACAVFILAIS
ncbi:hypothetical protein ACROYT_G038222 [Oculina patagonica]